MRGGDDHQARTVPCRVRAGQTRRRTSTMRPLARGFILPDDPDPEIPPAFAFDLLRLSGTGTTSWPYRRRRAALESVFAARRLSAPWALCPSTTDVAREWLTWASVGMEGVVFKRLNDAYRPSARGWQKYKIRETSEAIVGAITGSPAAPRTLLLGRCGGRRPARSGAARSSVDRLVVLRRVGQPGKTERHAGGTRAGGGSRRRRRPRRLRPVAASRPLAPFPPRPLPRRRPPPDVTAPPTATGRGGRRRATRRARPAPRLRPRRPSRPPPSSTPARAWSKGVATGMSAARPRRTPLVTCADSRALRRPAQRLPQHSAQHGALRGEAAAGRALHRVAPRPGAQGLELVAGRAHDQVQDVVQGERQFGDLATKLREAMARLLAGEPRPRSPGQPRHRPPRRRHPHRMERQGRPPRTPHPRRGRPGRDDRPAPQATSCSQSRDHSAQRQTRRPRDGDREPLPREPGPEEARQRPDTRPTSLLRVSTLTGRGR